MQILSSTDGKYRGWEVPDLQVGNSFTLGDFVLEVQFRRVLENGRICIGNPNYQLILEV